MPDNIILDTNIIISILIKPSGKVAELFYKLRNAKELFISDFTFNELTTHAEKIQGITKYSPIQLEQIQFEVLSQLHVISKDIIPEKYIFDAIELCKEVDIKDVPFVAVTLLLNGALWTGDKKLLTALKKKGFDNIFSSKDIETFLQL